jgi:hypothetical protein
MQPVCVISGTQGNLLCLNVGSEHGQSGCRSVYFVVPVGNYQVVTASGELFGQGEPDAAAGTGYQS